MRLGKGNCSYFTVHLSFVVGGGCAGCSILTSSFRLIDPNVDLSTDFFKHDNPRPFARVLAAVVFKIDVVLLVLFFSRWIAECRRRELLDAVLASES